MHPTPGAGFPNASRNQVVILGLLIAAAILCVSLVLFDQFLTVRQPVVDSAVPVTLIPSSTPFPENQELVVALLSSATASSTALPPVAADPNSDRFATLTPAPAAWQPGQPYIVQTGQTIGGVAAAVGVTEDDLRAANAMYGDALLPGQAVNIPNGPASYPDWRYASLDNDLADAAYPLVFDSTRFRMHYMPDTFTAVDPKAVAGMIERGMAFIEQSFGKPLGGTFDVYVAGTLFEPPDRYLLGKSISLDRKVFWLHNGSGEAVRQQYLAAHELTHLYAWSTFGQPFSFLLSEGAAVYTGMKMISGSRYLPIKDFCAAYKLENALPLLYTKTVQDDFRGHNSNLVNYFSSGCMVGYLIETYGVEKFGQAYHTQDYETVYGKPLEALEEEWKASIDTSTISGKMDTRRLVSSVSQFMRANSLFYDTFDGSPRSILAYRMLDRAGLALFSADLDGFDAQMQLYQDAVGQ